MPPRQARWRALRDIFRRAPVRIRAGALPPMTEPPVGTDFALPMAIPRQLRGECPLSGRRHVIVGRPGLCDASDPEGNWNVAHRYRAGRPLVIARAGIGGRPSTARSQNHDLAIPACTQLIQKNPRNASTTTTAASATVETREARPGDRRLQPRDRAQSELFRGAE